jgi:hypothetical protein
MKLLKEFRRIQKEEQQLVKSIRVREDFQKKFTKFSDCGFFVTTTTNLLYNCFNQKKIEEKEKSNGQNININLILK